MLLAYSSIWLLLFTPIVNFFRDAPGLRKVHQQDTPRAGGVCIAFAFGITQYLWWQFFPASFSQFEPHLIQALIFSGFCMLLVGVIDDTTGFVISNKAKFFLELLVACLVVGWFQVVVTDISLFGFSIQIGWLGYPLCVFWIVGVTNAINIIDGIDGLSGCVALLIFLTLGVLAALIQHPEISVLCFILSGLTLGFLVHNTTPARVFLGDTGALFYGMVIGILTIYVMGHKNPETGTATFPILVAPLAVGLPLVDVFAAMARRFFKALFNKSKKILQVVASMTIADNEHIHHRFVYRGLHHSETTLVLSLFQSSLCASALLMATLGARSLGLKLLILAYLGLIILWLLYRLNFFDEVIEGIGWRLEKRSTPETQRTSVAVVEASEVLKHSLANFPQDQFSFNFRTSDEMIPKHEHFDLVLLNNRYDNRLEADLHLATNLVLLYQCPIIVATSVFDLPQEKLRGMHIIKKPVYIPVLMSEMTNISGNVRFTRAFEKVVKRSRRMGTMRLNVKSIKDDSNV